MQSSGTLTLAPARPAAPAPAPAPLDLLTRWFAEATRPDAALHPRLVRYADGRIAPLPVHVWAGPVTDADQSLLDRAAGPVLDVGCGPGRLTAALHRRGTEAVGLDVDASIPVLAEAAGAPVLLGSVWGDLPREGGWGSVLLADGNVGIGGDPTRLLRRLRRLLRPDGAVLVELQPADEPPVAGDSVLCRLEELGRASAWFRWGVLGRTALADVAAAAGLRVGETWSCDQREFASLSRG